MKQKQISGILSALVTPYDDAGKVNYSVIRDLVKFQLSAGLTVSAFPENWLTKSMCLPISVVICGSN